MRLLYLASILILPAFFAACRQTQPQPESVVVEQSVRPEVNSRFLDPALNVEEFVKTFEGESREIARSRPAIVGALALAPGQHVADIGAGTGLFLDVFSEAVGHTGGVHALEISPKFVEHLQVRAEREGLGNVQVGTCSERSIGLAPATIDVAFVCDTYHHFEYPQSTLASIYAALRPGGRLYVLDFERIEGVSRPWVLEHVRLGKAEMRAEVEAAGFRYDVELTVSGLAENYLVRFIRP